MTTGANPLAHLSAELDELKAAHLYRPLRVMSTANGTRVTVDGRDVISLASNNYLGLNTHPRLVEAAAERGAALRRRVGRRAHDLGDDDPPRGAGDGTRDVQARRGGPHVPVRLHLQHRGHPGRGRRAGPHRVRPAEPRLHHRRDAHGEGAPRDLPAQGRGTPARAADRGPPRRAAGRPAIPGDPGRHRWRLQHGRRHRAAAGDRGRRRGARRRGLRRRRPRLGRPGSQRPGQRRPFRPPRARGDPGRHPEQGDGRPGRLRRGTARPPGDAHPARPALPVLHLAPAGRGGRLPGRDPGPGGRAGAHRAPLGEHAPLQGGASLVRLRHRPLGDADHAGPGRRLGAGNPLRRPPPRGGCLGDLRGLPDGRPRRRPAADDRDGRALR